MPKLISSSCFAIHVGDDILEQKCKCGDGCLIGMGKPGIVIECNEDVDET